MMSVLINTLYEWGETVYLKTDVDQSPRIVIAYKLYKQGEIMYELSCGTINSMHYDFEISKTKDYVLNSD